MDRAIEAIEAGNDEEAISLCRGMRHEWALPARSDGRVDARVGVLHPGAVGRRRGLPKRGSPGLERGWRRDTQAILGRDRREIVETLAATWRAHSTSGVGPEPGAFTIEEDDEKFTFRMNPCGSGQRLWRRGMYEGDHAYGVTHEAHDWSYGRAGFPLYCTPLCIHERTAADQVVRGTAVSLGSRRRTSDRDPCTWYWYKDPADIPDRHWARYGLSKSEQGVTVPGCALVTGAAQGIGRAIALALAADGWSVAACDRGEAVRDVVHEVEGRGGRAAAMCFDVRDADASREAHARAAAELGPLSMWSWPTPR
jgi:hypothetical protein